MSNIPRMWMSSNRNHPMVRMATWTRLIDFNWTHLKKVANLPRNRKLVMIMCCKLVK